MFDIIMCDNLYTVYHILLKTKYDVLIYLKFHNLFKNDT